MTFYDSANDLLIADLCTVAEKAKNREIINNLNNKRNATSLLPTSMSTSTAASQVKKVKHAEILYRENQVSTILNNKDDLLAL